MTLLFLTYSLVESFSVNYRSSLHPDFGHHLKCINTMDPLEQHLMTISLTSHATFLEIRKQTMFQQIRSQARQTTWN